MSTSEVAYVGVMVGVGTRDEQPPLNGLAHYIEHTVFKGAGNLSARQIINHIEGIGGEINAYTTKEETTFYAATPVGHYKQTLRLILDMVTRPTFPKAETDKEVCVILDEIDSYEDSPSELIYDDFENLIFQGHPLSMPILGTKKSVRKIGSRREYAMQWIADLYTPDKMVVFTQGAMPFESVVRLVESIIGEKARGEKAKGDRQAPGEIVVQSQTYRKHTHQVHAMVGGRAYPIGHERQLGMYFLNQLLGGGSLNSRLNLSLREQRGLVYTIESQYTPLSDSGYWSIYFATEPQHKDECVDRIYQELRRLRETSLTGIQFHRALQQLRGQMAISAENKENNVLAMAKLMLYHSKAPTWQETYSKIEQTTPYILQDIANDLLTENTISTLFYV